MLKVEPVQYLAHIKTAKLRTINADLGVYYSLKGHELIVLNIDGETVTVIQK